MNPDNISPMWWFFPFGPDGAETAPLPVRLDEGESAFARKSPIAGPEGKHSLGISYHNGPKALTLEWEPDAFEALPVPPAVVYAGQELPENPLPAFLVVRKDRAIDPAIYLRDKVFPGHPVVMGGGKAWRVPVCRLHLNRPGLPQRMRFDESGGTVWDVDPAFEELDRFADRFFDLFACQNEESDLKTSDLDEAAIRAITLNYRVSKAEIVLLGLMTTEGRTLACQAMIDWPTTMAEMDAADKKKGLPA